MTTEVFVQNPTYVISGVGPYTVTIGYQAGALVLSVDQGGTVTPLAPADFVTTPSSSAAGGTITLSTAAAALYDGATLIIERDTPLEQGWEGLYTREKGLEDQLDRMVQAAQDLVRLAALSLRVPGGENGLVTLPTEAARANKALLFDATGAPIAGDLLPGDTIATAFAQTILDDPDAAAVRATLALGTAAVQNVGAFATAAQGALADTALQTSLQVIGGDVAILAADRGKYFRVAGTHTIDLPDPAVVGAGFVVTFAAVGGDPVIDAANGGQIEGSPSLTLADGSIAEVRSNGTDWTTAISPGVQRSDLFLQGKIPVDKTAQRAHSTWYTNPSNTEYLLVKFVGVSTTTTARDFLVNSVQDVPSALPMDFVNNSNSGRNGCTLLVPPGWHYYLDGAVNNWVWFEFEDAP